MAVMLLASTAFTQDLTSKKGETMLPEEGDYSLGFDADPFLNYVGNFLNQAGNNSPGADFTNSNLAITGKMFKDAQTAYRGRVRIGFGSASSTVLTDTSSTSTPAYIEDKTTTSYNAIVLGGGLEKRRGDTRVQGFYGAEALITLSGGKDSFEFGIPVSASNPNARITENKSGSSLGVTARGFAGVEIFVFPKTSVGFEFGWGLGFASTGSGETMTEFWDGDSVETITTETGTTSSFGIDTDNSGGALVINFHF